MVTIESWGVDPSNENLIENVVLHKINQKASYFFGGGFVALDSHRKEMEGNDTPPEGSKDLASKIWWDDLCDDLVTE